MRTFFKHYSTCDGEDSVSLGCDSPASEVGDEADELNVNADEPTPLAETDFKSWHLRDFSAYCLVQIHMPVLSIVWSDSAGGEQKKCVLDPDPKIVAQLLTKVTYHIDCLLEDWYPDLGTRFHQSTSGTLLIHRIVPCTACIRHISPCSSEATGDANGTSNIVYGILVEEFVHWFLSACGISALSGRLRLACPLHTTFAFPANDLVFDDIGDDFLLPTNKLFLERFLGRGTFGSVFAPANAVSAQTLRRLSTLTRNTGTNVLSTLNTPSSLASHPCSVSVVLGDYGVSRARANLDGCRGYVGTPGYMAPEILEHFGEETYTAKVGFCFFPLPSDCLCLLSLHGIFYSLPLLVLVFSHLCLIILCLDNSPPSPLSALSHC
ncbi:unnamed protein product [Dibothriocephalus latus]|uniref:Protein kinase domain-containing protein n=1 Tax=Dibothriocephalus latus TaxID=60516 RepID=A0A3P7L9J3_DIBLA|nr:unnamed protein product [Dibothriocephalus latus]